jgi:hypothetical protein
MPSFLRENWVWIVAPIVLLGLLVVALLILGPDASSPFDYPIR